MPDEQDPPPAGTKVAPEVVGEPSPGGAPVAGVDEEIDKRRWSLGSFDYPLKNQEVPRATFTFRRSESDLDTTDIHEKPDETKMQGTTRPAILSTLFTV